MSALQFCRVLAADCAVRFHYGDERKNVALEAERHVVAQFGNRQQTPRVFGIADGRRQIGLCLCVSVPRNFRRFGKLWSAPTVGASKAVPVIARHDPAASNSHNAPAARTSSSARFSRVPAQTSSTRAGWIFLMNSAVAPRFKKEPARTVWAPTQARSARVPLVVVETIVLPRTISGVNSRGELPRSKSVPPVCAARIFTPSRSPASRTSGLFFPDGQRLGNFGGGDDGVRAVAQRGHECAGGAQHVEHDARGAAQIAPGERGQFRRCQDGFNFHFMLCAGCEGAGKFSIQHPVCRKEPKDANRGSDKLLGTVIICSSQKSESLETEKMRLLRKMQSG